MQHFQVHLPKEDRKRGLIYIRDAIAAMRNATDVSSAVLLLAGLPHPGVPEEEAESDGEEERERRQDAVEEDDGSMTPLSPVSSKRSADAADIPTENANGGFEQEKAHPTRKRRRGGKSTSGLPTSSAGRDLATLAKAAAQIEGLSHTPEE